MQVAWFIEVVLLLNFVKKLSGQLINYDFSSLQNTIPQHFESVIEAYLCEDVVFPTKTDKSYHSKNGDTTGSAQWLACLDAIPTNNCSCIYTNTNYEIEHRPIDPEITLKIPGLYAKIQCYESSNHTTTIVPCPVISYFGMEHIKAFWVQNYGQNLELLKFQDNLNRMPFSLPSPTVTDVSYARWLVLRSHTRILRSVLSSFQAVIKLDLGDNQMSELEPRLFANHSWLRYLKLDRNQLRNITPDTFHGAENLQEVDLSSNVFASLGSDVFSLLKKLKMLNLSFNRLSVLPENLLSENRNLEQFILSNNQVSLPTLPENLLNNLMELKRVILSYNQLSSIPEQFLRDQLRLQDLNLAHNKLEMLPDGLFENTSELRTLQLSHNHLQNLSANIFVSLDKLTVLCVDNNYLHVIDLLMFSRTTALEELYMQNNQFSFEECLTTDATPFRYLSSLRILNLQNNNITTIFHDWNNKTIALRKLDLSYNHISALNYRNLLFSSPEITVNISNNRITKISVDGMDRGDPLDGARIKVDVTDNPLNCDCEILSLVQFLQTSEPHPIQFATERLRCWEPEEHSGVKLMSIRSEKLLCQLDEPDSGIHRCPENCSCFIRPVDRGIIVNCTQRGLVEVPSLPVPTKLGFSFLVLHIEHNEITGLPSDDLPGYADVAELYVQNNSLLELYPENVPIKLRVLDLSNNKLTTMTQSVLEKINRTSNMQLSGNPWRCDCDASLFFNFIQQNASRLGNLEKIMCDDGRKISSIMGSTLCHTSMISYIIISSFIATVLILMAMIVWFKYQLEIQVWLFTHNLCLCIVSEKELDRDKLYDAFISYSHKDEQFVTDHLVPTLEKEPMSFKICWHVRDWMPGEMIPTQIANSVDDSRRTIIVLSTNYVDSNWGRLEFQTAHQNSMAEKRLRVIVIIYDDIGDIEQLDPELKAYLKMNSYVKWGDPWFWDKLRYSMPHPPTVKGFKSNEKKSPVPLAEF
ncbi:protein toll-like [Malaya genurostris]|uniref:protein toll-like n=1 Tax=Malaya genurostris TaxID=325434 RepID=UPI0026F38F89|nr:protein toll-like [Malaya genurostris]